MIPGGVQVISLAAICKGCKDGRMRANSLFWVHSSFALLCLMPAVMARSAQKPGVPGSGQDPDKIYVDNYCRILATGLGGSAAKSKAFVDRGICAVDREHYSQREETTILAGKRKSVIVTIGEQTFLLHNPTSRPMTFVVNHGLSKGWQVDSDPPPNEVSGKAATFLLSATPGQTVQFHFGERNPPAR